MNRDRRKEFYYSTLYIYDKALNDALTTDFAESGERSKSKYLADLIEAGLSAKQRQTFQTDANRTEDLSDKLTAIEKKLEDLQRVVMSDQAEQATYRMLLCNAYFLLESLVYGEAFNDTCLEAGLFDGLPPRLNRLLTQLKEVYRRAA